MRKGIPKEMWGGVVTVYRDAKAIEAFTGTENKLPSRVVLLDAGGRVVFFHDEGFSPAALKRLRGALEKLENPSSRSP
jgi:hypothetical protein